MPEIEWLPEFIEPVDDETETQYLDRLYVFFCEELLSNPPDIFKPKSICFSSAITHGRCETFHHCVTADPNGQPERVFEPNRAKRIRWIRPMIDAALDAERTTSWRIRVRGELRFKIALPDFRYIVIFTESSNTMFFVSAFYVVDRNYREQLARERRRAELPI